MGSVYELAAESKAVAVVAEKLRFAIGWDAKKGSLKDKIKGLAEEHLGGISAGAYDLNIAALLKFSDGRSELVFYGAKEDKASSVYYLKDNRTGSGEGVDEALDVTLDRLPADLTEMVIFTLIFEGNKVKQNFGMVENFFVMVQDAKSDEVIYKNDTDTADAEAAKHSAYVFAKLVKNAGKWELIPQHRFSDENNEQDLVAGL